MSKGADLRPSAAGMSIDSGETAYRPISAMAVLCLVTSILSGLAFGHPVFWIVPAVTLVLSIVTSIRLEKARNEYAGQLPAKLAILLSLGFGIAAPTKYFVERYIIVEEAITHTNEFLDRILANQIKSAFKYTFAPLQRASANLNDDNEYVQRAPQLYREFVNDSLVRELAGKAPQAEVTIVGPEFYGFEGGFHTVTLQYRIAIPDDDIVYVLRTLAKGGVATSGEWKGRQWYTVGSRLETLR